MRNTTKLKHILLKFSMSVDTDDEGIFKISLVDKFKNNDMHSFEGKSWSAVIAKAYSHLLKDVKHITKNTRE